MKGVLFDLDETLIDRFAAVDSFAARLWRDYLASSGIDQREFVAGVHKIDGYGYTSREIFISELAKMTDSLIPADLISTAFYDQVWRTPRLADGVIDCLELLKRHQIPIGVVTNGGTEAQTAKLAASGLQSYFDVMLISEAFGAKKPAPEIFLAAAQQLNVKPKNCWFVGDHPLNDIVGSHQLGFRTGWIHLDRPWPEDHARCDEVNGASFAVVMNQITNRLL